VKDESDMSNNINTDGSGHTSMPAGTQVVTLVEVRSMEGNLIYPLNAVGVVIRSQPGEQVRYLVRMRLGTM
jgi:hypothetical protein